MSRPFTEYPEFNNRDRLHNATRKLSVVRELGRELPGCEVSEFKGQCERYVAEVRPQGAVDLAILDAITKRYNDSVWFKRDAEHKLWVYVRKEYTLRFPQRLYNLVVVMCFAALLVTAWFQNDPSAAKTIARLFK